MLVANTSRYLLNDMASAVSHYGPRSRVFLFWHRENDEQPLIYLMVGVHGADAVPAFNGPYRKPSNLVAPVVWQIVLLATPIRRLYMQVCSVTCNRASVSLLPRCRFIVILQQYWTSAFLPERCSCVQPPNCSHSQDWSETRAHHVQRASKICPCHGALGVGYNWGITKCHRYAKKTHQWYM